jgi:cytoskeletal protein CcmA (bactofilin family)
MFSKAKSKSARPVAPTILSADFTVTGDINSEGEVQIDGKVAGDVRCTTLTVGVAGSLTGQVFADHALIRGKVEGLIRAHNVTLTRTARVIGDIIHEALMIEPGAFIEGRCQHLDGVAAAPDKRLNLVVGENPKRGG